jgi:sulfur-oxidizing protein SoxY
MRARDATPPREGAPPADRPVRIGGRAMHRRTWLVWLLCFGSAAFAAPALQPGDDPQASPRWQAVHRSVFEGRAVLPAPWLVLEVAARAVDGAVVPLAIRARPPAGIEVERLVLVIDANPSPVSAIFQIAPALGRVEVETRVRIDDYTWVRALVQGRDGRVWGTTRFVKASGGCSAPPVGDVQEAAARLGRMKLRVDGDLGGREPVLATLAIEHPNHSGLAMDPGTRQVIGADFVRKVDVTYDGAPLFSADVDFSISENPNFRFRFVPRGAGGELRASIVDSHERRFSAVHALGAP